MPTLISDIADHLVGILRTGLDARKYAEQLVETADFSLAFAGKMQFEVRGADTATRNPHVFCVQMAAFDEA